MMVFYFENQKMTEMHRCSSKLLAALAFLVRRLDVHLRRLLRRLLLFPVNFCCKPAKVQTGVFAQKMGHNLGHN